MSTPASLGKTAAAGMAFVGTSQAVRIIVTILSTIVVARILSPGDYGVVAMVAPVTAFLLLFQNLGLSQAAIQAKTLDDHQSNALFWLNMAASAAIMLVLLALSPVVAWFYHDPRPGYVTAASALTVLLSGSAIQHMALLNREMRFARLSAIDIATSLVGFAATVLAAFILRSYWALWIGTFVGSLVGRSLVWRSSRWRPSLKVSFAESWHLVRFGGSITGFNLINFLIRNLDNILIGRVWGPGALGLYDRSYRLMMFPLQNINAPLGRVVLPVLARLRDEPERYRRCYLLILRGLTLATIPAIAVAVATSDRLIPFLLGPRWSAASPIFFWLSLAAFLQPVGNSTGWLFMSSGRPGAMMRWAAFQMLMMVPAFVIGVQWGPVGVAAAYFLVLILLVPLLLIYCVRGTSLSVWDLYAASAPSFISAGLIWIGLEWLTPKVSMAPLLCVAIPTAYAVNIAVLSLTSAGRESLSTMFALATSALSVRQIPWLWRRSRVSVES